MTDIQVHFASDRSLLVMLGNEISREQQRKVAQLCAVIERDRYGAVQNVHPAYGSVLITFDPRRTSAASMAAAARKWLERMSSIELPPARRVEIPVCYGSSFGPDLPDVAAHTGLSCDDVVRIHSSAEYFVYFLGFSPGFPYLGDLPRELAVPRLGTPRTRVPAGSVAIGGTQTGVYPLASPGGWRIIGRTPLKLFEPLGESPTLLQMGDLVNFEPISEEEFVRVAEEPE
ncbi:MAG: 5-oxoprolinase subunit PxpB [Acidobacteria bacterium]|nr:5-oxoprolinase subunit PxpB [Acidobacteriota bacterium]